MTAALVATLVIAAITPAVAGAVGGPVILGGDDLTDHGSVNGSGDAVQGWLYIQKAIGNLKAQVTRTNDNSIAAFGSSASGATSGDAGAAIGLAATKNSMTVQYFDGAAAIISGFTSIANGSYSPAIVWIAGDGANNDIDSCAGAGSEGEAITNNASVVNSLVNQGGGLMAHSLCYGWLTALVPGLTTVSAAGAGPDLYLTPEGTSAFPGLTSGDVGSGAWHAYFEGDFGGLQALVRSNTVNDSTGGDAAVVIGGGQVSLTEKPADLAVSMIASPDPVSANGNITYTMTITNNGPNPATGVNLADSLPAGLTFVSASASQGSCSGTTTVVCGLGNLASGASATVTIVARATGTGSISNTASVSGDQPDPSSANDAASATTAVAAASPSAPTQPPQAGADRRAPRVRVGRVAGSGQGCTSEDFNVRFTITDSSALRRADVRLDGRRIHRTKRKRFSVSIRVSGLRAGRHTLQVIALDSSNNRRTVSRAFRKCATAAAVPRFTG